MNEQVKRLEASGFSKETIALGRAIYAAEEEHKHNQARRKLQLAKLGVISSDSIRKD